MAVPYILALVTELDNLRHAYEAATPRQRLAVVHQRLNNPTAHANELVTKVSAVEAYARSLVANAKVNRKGDLLRVYSRYARREATGLVTEYLKIHKKTPREYFGDELWELFRLAVSFRNLLVHECTYLDTMKFLPMAHACTEVLMSLSQLSKSKGNK